MSAALELRRNRYDAICGAIASGLNGPGNFAWWSEEYQGEIMDAGDAIEELLDTIPDGVLPTREQLINTVAWGLDETVPENIDDSVGYRDELNNVADRLLAALKDLTP